MFFRFNVIGAVIDVFLFSYVFIYLLLLFWCTGYRVGKSIMYEKEPLLAGKSLLSYALFTGKTAAYKFCVTLKRYTRT